MNIIRFNGKEDRPTLAAFVSNWIILYLLPVGFFVLLTGLFWLGEKSLYHKLYYLLVAAPTLAVFLLRQTGTLKKLLRNPIIFAFILFGAYTILTLFWSDTDHAISSLVRRPLNLLLLFLSFGLVALKTPGKIFNILALSAKVSVVCGGLSLIYFLFTHYNSGINFSTLPRFPGYGAISNPLLTSHVYGFFTAFFLALWFSGRHPKPLYVASAFAILSVVLLSTGSRTPILALTITFVWLSLCYRSRRSLITIGVMLTSGFTLFLVNPEILTSRGLSHRPGIWMSSLQKGIEHPWFGHGFDHSMSVYVETAKTAFYDPHNIEIAVFLAGGIVGLTLWMALYVIAMRYAWQNRDNYLVMISAALLVYGFAAGLTEGGEFLTRPKEHWFLIWIPFALLSSTWVANDQQKTTQLENPDT